MKALRMKLLIINVKKRGIKLVVCECNGILWPRKVHQELYKIIINK